MDKGLLLITAPLYLCLLLPMAHDQTKTLFALMVGLFSCSEVDALHLISIAAFTLPPPPPDVSGKGREGEGTLVAAICI